MVRITILKLINKILIDKSITSRNLNTIETKLINPLLNRINPEFVELNFQVYQLGTTYLNQCPQVKKSTLLIS